MKTILVSAGVALILALFGTPLAIRVFTRRGYGQLIREVGPAHATKRGTPTMGGTVIVIATLVGYFVGHVATSDPSFSAVSRPKSCRKPSATSRSGTSSA